MKKLLFLVGALVGCAAQDSSEPDPSIIIDTCAEAYACFKIDCAGSQCDYCYDNHPESADQAFYAFASCELERPDCEGLRDACLESE